MSLSKVPQRRHAHRSPRSICHFFVFGALRSSSICLMQAQGVVVLLQHVEPDYVFFALTSLPIRRCELTEGAEQD